MQKNLLIILLFIGEIIFADFTPTPLVDHDQLLNTHAKGGVIGQPVTGGTIGSLLFVNPSGNLGQDNSNLFWDDTNNFLGLGTVIPAYKLDVAGDVNVTGNFKINGSNIPSGTVTSVSGTAPISVATGTSTPVVSIVQATSSVSGYLSSTDWSTFNLKAPTASPTFTGTVTIPSPFTLGSTSVTTTGTQLNYLNAATGTTGTTSTNAVFSGSPTVATPTFTTSIVTPLVIGGSGVTQTLTYKTTTGVGATGADHIFQVGNNGATEAMRILNSGNVGIGATTAAQKLDVTGKIALNGTTVAYYPTTMTGSLVLGNGGTNLLNTVGNDGWYNTFAGIGAGVANTTGSLNTLVGYNSGVAITSGSNNSFYGYLAGATLSTGSNNVGVGYFALTSMNGSNNTAVGYRAAVATTGQSNTAVGYQAINGTGSGGSNAAVGASSMQNVTTGGFNASLGANALLSNTTGINNTAIGSSALRDLLITNGSGDNTAIGFNTGRGITTGTQNTIVGANVTGLSASLSNNIIIADGAGNQRLNVDSTGNVGIGTTSPRSKLDVRDTLYIGTAGATHGVINSDDGIFFNNDADNNGSDGFFAFGTNRATDTGGSEWMRIINTGLVGIGTTVPASNLDVVGTAKASTSLTTPLLIGGSGVTQTLTYKTTTGVGATGADHIFQVGNNGATEAMRILNNGSVGIGTTAPSRQLELAGASDAYIQLTRANSTSNQATLGFKTGVTDDWLLRTASGGSDLNLYSYGTSTNVFTVLKSSGNVGIGTAAPSVKLEVTGNVLVSSAGAGIIQIGQGGSGGSTIGALAISGGTLAGAGAKITMDGGGTPLLYFGRKGSIDGSTSNTIQLRSENDFDLKVNGTTTALFADTAGNVGIGTTAPSELLHVAGFIKADFPNGCIGEYNANTAGTNIAITTAATFYGYVTAAAIGTNNGLTFVDNATADRLDVDTGKEGDYRVSVNGTFGATNGAIIECCVHKTGTKQNNSCSRTKMGTSDTQNLTSNLILYDLADTDYLDIRCTSDTNGDVVRPEILTLCASRVGR